MGTLILVILMGTHASDILIRYFDGNPNVKHFDRDQIIETI